MALTPRVSTRSSSVSARPTRVTTSDKSAGKGARVRWVRHPQLQSGACSPPLAVPQLLQPASPELHTWIVPSCPYPATYCPQGLTASLPGRLRRA